MYNENIDDKMRVPMSLYFYPENFVPPDVGDIIYCPERVPKIVIGSEKDKITLQSLTGRKNILTFLEFNNLLTYTSTKIFKPCVLEPKNLYVMLDASNTQHIIFIKHIDNVNVEAYIRINSDSNIVFENKIRIADKDWGKITINNTKGYIFIPLYTFSKSASVRWPKKILSSEKEVKQYVLNEIHNNIKERFYNFHPNDRLTATMNLSDKIAKHLISHLQLKMSISYSIPSCNQLDMIMGNYQLLEPGCQYNVDISKLKLEYVFPKLKIRVQKNSLVKYIGNKINVRYVKDLKWTVIDIKQSKDNPDLDQCTIVNHDVNTQQYTVFRKELKLIKNNQIIYERKS